MSYKMTMRQQRYKKNRLMGMSQYNAARAAGYSHATAKNAFNNVEKRCDFRAILEQAGLTDQKVAETVADCLQADRAVVCDKEIHEVPDNMTRLEAAKVIMKIKGHLVDKPLIDNSTHTHYSLTKLAQELAAERQNGTDAGTKDRTESDLRQARGVLEEGLGGLTLGEASRNHALSEGQPENDSPKQ